MKKRNKKNRSKDKQTQSKKREVRVKSPEDRFLWKLVGVALLAFSAFVATALASYDWRSVASLNPKPTETTNLVGVIGNAFAYGVFLSFGFAGWCIPVASFLGSLKLLQPIPKEIEEIPNGRVCVRICGLVLMALAVSGLFQLTGHWQWVRELVAYTYWEPCRWDGWVLVHDLRTRKGRGSFWRNISNARRSRCRRLHGGRDQDRAFVVCRACGI